MSHSIDPILFSMPQLFYLVRGPSFQLVKTTELTQNRVFSNELIKSGSRILVGRGKWIVDESAISRLVFTIPFILAKKTYNMAEKKLCTLLPGFLHSQTSLDPLVVVSVLFVFFSDFRLYHMLCFLVALIEHFNFLIELLQIPIPDSFAIHCMHASDSSRVYFCFTFTSFLLISSLAAWTLDLIRHHKPKPAKKRTPRIGPKKSVKRSSSECCFEAECKYHRRPRSDALMVTCWSCSQRFHPQCVRDDIKTDEQARQFAACRPVIGELSFESNVACCVSFPVTHGMGLTGFVRCLCVPWMFGRK